MSISIDQVLADAKRLVERLRSHDSAADSLIQQTSGLNKRIETMTEFQEEVEEMNSIARHRPRTALILGIQRENRQIRQLQEENGELVAVLKQHQAALDLIMSSYREQITKIHASHKSEKCLVEKHSKETHETAQYIHKIIEMAAVMQRAADSDETYCYKMEEMIAKLEYENKGLRELLRITKSVTKGAVPPLSPAPIRKGVRDNRGVTEDGGSSHAGSGMIASEDPTMQRGASSRVEICEDSLEGDSVVENCITRERVGVGQVEGSAVAQGSKTGLTNNHEAEDTGGGGSGGGPMNDSGSVNVGKVVVKKVKSCARSSNTDSGAIAKSRNVSKNNNKESVMELRIEETGPRRGDVVAGNDMLSRLNALTNCKDDSDIPDMKGNLPNLVLAETGNSSEEYDTSSLSSQSSMSTVKEVDTISIGSEFSDSGGDMISEKFIEQELVGVDSTHL